MILRNELHREEDQRRLSASGLSDRGFTLLELIVVMVMTSILTGTIFFAGQGFNRHVIRQNRKAMMHHELRMLSQSMASQLRRSPAVLAWHQRGITYVSPVAKDTVVFDFSSGQFLRNDTLVPVISTFASITDFTIESDMPSVQPPSNAALTLLRITITLSNTFLESYSMTTCTAAKVIKTEQSETDTDLWNF
ncbi:MAG: type II secretion system protein [Chitinivibrionales bacterium]|nr:type II secretion system protein [Chitinivibrionales bacterium]